MEEPAASTFSMEKTGKNGEKCITHYSSCHRILLVGEGDFSFSACLARAFGSANNMVATSYDDRGNIDSYCAISLTVQDVSHRDDKPYIQWRIRSSAKKRGLILKDMMEFQKKDYPGYHNKRGSDIDGNKTFPLGYRCFTFKFSLKNHLEENENFRKISTDQWNFQI